MEQWERVARAIRMRRGVLGLSQREAAQLARVTPSTWRNIEAGRGDGHREGTLVTVSLALGWDADALIQIRDGGPLPTEDQDLALRDEVARLRRELDDLRAEYGGQIGDLKDLVNRERRARPQAGAPPTGRAPGPSASKGLAGRSWMCQAQDCRTPATVVVERPAPRRGEGAERSRFVSLCDAHDKQFRQGVPVAMKDEAPPGGAGS